MKIVDTHTHLDGEEFDEDRSEVILRAKEAGVGMVFLPAIDVKTSEAVLKLSHEYPGYAYPMVGLHPEEVKADWKEQLKKIKQPQPKPTKYAPLQMHNLMQLKQWKKHFHVFNPLSKKLPARPLKSLPR